MQGFRSAALRICLADPLLPNAARCRQDRVRIPAALSVGTEYVVYMIENEREIDQPRGRPNRLRDLRGGAQPA